MPPMLAEFSLSSSRSTVMSVTVVGGLPAFSVALVEGSSDGLTSSLQSRSTFSRGVPSSAAVPEGCLLANLPVGLHDHAENAPPKNLGLALEAGALDVALGNIELVAGHIGHCRVLSRPTTGQPYDDDQRNEEAKRAYIPPD